MTATGLAGTGHEVETEGASSVRSQDLQPVLQGPMNSLVGRRSDSHSEFGIFRAKIIHLLKTYYIIYPEMLIADTLVQI